MSKPLHIVALSGGKDSTAMALALKEKEPRDYTYICTPTGDELPEMLRHWEQLEKILGQDIVRLTAKTDLNGLIDHMNMIPNFRARWCTRILKIEAAQAFYLKHPGSVAYVGLRADEPERRGGIYGDIVEQRYPLREWGWTVDDVWDYLDCHGIEIPPRTDCARCFHQRLGEWWDLWNQYPEVFREAEAQEIKYGHTFRSKDRDTWPADLRGLRKRFEAGDVPRGANVQGELFGMEARRKMCRVCSL